SSPVPAPVVPAKTGIPAPRSRPPACGLPSPTSLPWQRLQPAFLRENQRRRRPLLKPVEPVLRFELIEQAGSRVRALYHRPVLDVQEPLAPGGELKSPHPAAALVPLGSSHFLPPAS